MVKIHPKRPTTNKFKNTKRSRRKASLMLGNLLFPNLTHCFSPLLGVYGATCNLIDYIYQSTWLMTIFPANSFDRWAPTHSFMETSNKTYLKPPNILPSNILTAFIFVFLFNPHLQTFLSHGVVNMLKDFAFCALHLNVLRRFLL